MCGLLSTASPDPTKKKWFSCAVCLRSVSLGLDCHELLKRAWLKEFAAEKREALEREAEDQARAGL